MINPCGSNAGSTGLFHPCPGTAGTATHREFPVLGHFNQVQVHIRAKELPGWFIDPVVTPKEARVVVGHGLRLLRVWRNRSQRPLPDQTVQQLRVVDDVVVATKLGELVGNRVEAVRACHHDPLGFDFVQGFNGRFRKHLEEDLIAGAASRVARATLRGSEDTEGNTRGVKQFGDRGGGAFRLLIVCSGAAHPEEVVEVGGVLYVLADHREIKVEFGRPV